jgi:hypothetical protein
MENDIAWLFLEENCLMNDKKDMVVYFVKRVEIKLSRKLFVIAWNRTEKKLVCLLYRVVMTLTKSNIEQNTCSIFGASSERTDSIYI